MVDRGRQRVREQFQQRFVERIESLVLRRGQVQRRRSVHDVVVDEQRNADRYRDVLIPGRSGEFRPPVGLGGVQANQSPGAGRVQARAVFGAVLVLVEFRRPRMRGRGRSRVFVAQHGDAGTTGVGDRGQRGVGQPGEHGIERLEPIQQRRELIESIGDVFDPPRGVFGIHRAQSSSSTRSAGPGMCALRRNEHTPVVALGLPQLPAEPDRPRSVASPGTAPT